MSQAADQMLHAQAEARLHQAQAIAKERKHLSRYGLMADLHELLLLAHALEIFARAARMLGSIGDEQIATGLLDDVGRLRELAIEDLLGFAPETTVEPPGTATERLADALGREWGYTTDAQGRVEKLP